MRKQAFFHIKKSRILRYYSIFTFFAIKKGNRHDTITNTKKTLYPKASAKAPAKRPGSIIDNAIKPVQRA